MRWLTGARFLVLKKLAGKVMDVIADMLTMIRNAQAVKKPEVFIPFSSLKFEIAKVLEKEGFVEKVEKKGKSPKKKIKIVLRYDESGRGAISGLKRVSRPGRRIYLGWRDIKPVRSGYGILILSTSHGILTDKEARSKKVGGEVICEVW